MINGLSPEWREFLGDELCKPYFNQLMASLEQAYSAREIFPPVSLVFNAFSLCPPQRVRVVIIGQDPYHGLGQAQGLCFSVPPGIKPPPSLKNIYKELSSDIPGFAAPAHGDLSPWASQGVLLLNAILTVESGKPGSHRLLGWETFTNAVIRKLALEQKNLVFFLWGAFAQSKQELINADKHLVLKAAHPSPLARGAFFGCRHFSKANDYLRESGKLPINWHLS